ncbi:MAG: flagellar basal body rod protein FlgB [Bosea sp. (in: a-proteobacteria)]
MAVAGIGLMEALKTRMQWHQARQKLLAENVANSDTPKFQPHDLRAPSAKGSPDMVARTHAGHMTLDGPKGGFDPKDPRRFEKTPSGNAVNLEDEMMKVAQNQSDYQLAASLYSKSLSLMKIAIGKGR